MKEKLKWALTIAFILLSGVVLFGQSTKEKEAVSVEETRKMIAKDSTFARRKNTQASLGTLNTRF